MPEHRFGKGHAKEVKPETEFKAPGKWSHRTIAVQEGRMPPLRMERRPKRDLKHRIARKRIFPVDQARNTGAVREDVVTAEVTVQKARLGAGGGALQSSEESKDTREL